MAALTVLAVLVSTFALASPAQAVETIPTLQWPAVSTAVDTPGFMTSPNGDVTIPCYPYNATPSDLFSYNAAGQEIRHIVQSVRVDGITNCISSPSVDKSGDLYGVPRGKKVDGNAIDGPNLLAYKGNVIKWKYPVSSCPGVAVGANGNIYTVTYLADGAHLIGLAPNLTTGQTQPTKVLDVKIDACRRPIAYKDGLLLSTTENARFYSYSGKNLGEVAINYEHHETLNAEGQLFTQEFSGWIYQPEGGTYQTATVSKYNPAKRVPEWSKQVSTPGARVKGIYPILPMANGGVIVVVREQKMITPGVPASPDVWVDKIVRIESSGQVINSLVMPDKGAGDRSYYQTSYTVDGTGKVAFVRQLNSGAAMPSELTLGVWNSADNTMFYQGAMRTADSGAGYWHNAGYIELNNNTLFLVASVSGVARLYAVKVTGLGMEYPRAAVLTATVTAQPAPVPYVALGDSYSSGEGVEPFDPATNAAPNTCHRSELAYSKIIGRNPKLAASLETGKFVACSGAETVQIMNDNTVNGELAQHKSLLASTKLVTVTIGGNDIGFADFGTACVVEVCKIGSPAYTTALNKINNTLPAKLEAAYKKLLDSPATTAKIYVVSYPQVAPVKTASDLEDLRCSYLYNSGYDSTGTVKTNWADAQAARDIVTKLNAKILATVNKVRAIKTAYQRLQYVDANASASPFVGHTVCADPGDSFFNNLDQWPGHPAYALHPNAKGQQAYADLVTKAMTG